jgi:hypothetical protein
VAKDVSLAVGFDSVGEWAFGVCEHGNFTGSVEAAATSLLDGGAR